MLEIVQKRRAVIGEARPFDGQCGVLYLVRLECKDDGVPEAEEWIWERELNRQSLEPNTLPQSSDSPVSSKDFVALVRAAQWTPFSTISPLTTKVRWGGCRFVPRFMVETLRLAEYGLSHDQRANEFQPVRACFGPRVYDWQIEQSPEESWQECHLHERNLLGPEGYQALVDELAGRTEKEPADADNTRSSQQTLDSLRAGNQKGSQRELF